MKKMLIVMVFALVALALAGPVCAADKAPQKDQSQDQVQAGEAATVSAEQLELVKKREAAKTRRDELLKQRQQMMQAPAAGPGGLGNAQ